MGTGADFSNSLNLIFSDTLVKAFYHKKVFSTIASVKSSKYISYKHTSKIPIKRTNKVNYIAFYVIVLGSPATMCSHTVARGRGMLPENILTKMV